MRLNPIWLRVAFANLSIRRAAAADNRGRRVSNQNRAVIFRFLPQRVKLWGLRDITAYDCHSEAVILMAAKARVCAVLTKRP